MTIFVQKSVTVHFTVSSMTITVLPEDDFSPTLSSFLSCVRLTSLQQAAFLSLLLQSFLLHCLPFLHRDEGLLQSPAFPFGSVSLWRGNPDNKGSDTARQLSDEVRSDRQNYRKKKKTLKKTNTEALIVL